MAAQTVNRMVNILAHIKLSLQLPYLLLTPEKLSLSPQFRLMSTSSHIQSVLIGFEYRICRQTLDIHLFFAV